MGKAEDFPNSAGSRGAAGSSPQPAIAGCSPIEGLAPDPAHPGDPAKDSELFVRIRAMAARWGYADDELAEALRLAKADPVGWLRLVEHDEKGRDESNLCRLSMYSFFQPYR